MIQKAEDQIEIIQRSGGNKSQDISNRKEYIWEVKDGNFQMGF